MKRATNVVLVVALLVSLFAGVAVAKTFVCDSQDDNDPNPLICEGTNNADVITGTSNGETIKAKAKNDSVRAGGGDDTVDGKTGADTLVGEAGCDHILGGTGKDTLDAADNDDCTTPLVTGAAEFVRAGPSNDKVLRTTISPT